MKIEVWSDYVCPFCYIGKKELERAIKETGLTQHVNVEYKAYELDPTTDPSESIHVKEPLMQKKGLSEEQVEGMFKQVTLRAKEVGLAYDFSKMWNANTKRAHQLAKFAKTKGKEAEMNEALLQAHFLEYRSLNLEENLLDVAEEVGLDRTEAKTALQEDKFLEEVNADIEEARQLGIQGVPFFVIERKYGISGAQPQEVFQDTLKKVAQELNLQPSLQIIGSGDLGTCSDESCSF